MTEERVKRKLSAILSADVAGYSRLMGEDEVSTVRTLEAYRKVMSDLIEQFRGRVVDSPGDNLLSEFSSVVDAVQCAVEIHEVIRAKNEELPEDRRMLFRIGVNLGDVIEEGDRIYGDGVNIAARLEGLAEAGGICISGSAHEQIKNKLALGYEYIGEHRVKNIAEPLKVYRVPMGPKAAFPREGDEKKTKLKNWQWTALGAAGVIIVIIGAVAIWNFYLRGPSIEPASIEPEKTSLIPEIKESPKTIAVLPFDDLSPEKDQEYFVLGLSEEILNSLCQIPGLGVTGKTSSFSFKGTKKTIQEISSVLGVDHILGGSVKKAGSALRITAQLVRTSDGLHLWSETYDRELKDIFRIQEDIANSVAEKLKLTLEAFQLLGGTENIDAYERYLVAKGLAGQGSAENIEPAILEQKLIEEAIALDPEFALAWIWKARIHNYWSMVRSIKNAADEKAIALSAVSKAIELEPDLASGYYWLGTIKNSNCDFMGAEQTFQKALQLTAEPFWESPITIAAHYFMVGYLKRAHEIVKESRRSDPLLQINRNIYIRSLALLGDTQQAEEEYKRIRALVGQSHWDDMMITDVRILARNIVSRADIVYSDPINDVAKHHLTSPKEGLVDLHKLLAENDITCWELISISAWAAYFGDLEFTLDSLKKGVSMNASTYFHWYPVFHDVRQTLRFKEWVREIGLVDYWKEYGWPDLCRPIGDDDFVCD
jgi:TolB-like protein/class 3 adenylate cyclase